MGSLEESPWGSLWESPSALPDRSLSRAATIMSFTLHLSGPGPVVPGIDFTQSPGMIAAQCPFRGSISCSWPMPKRLLSWVGERFTDLSSLIRVSETPHCAPRRADRAGGGPSKRSHSVGPLGGGSPGEKRRCVGSNSTHSSNGRRDCPPASSAQHSRATGSPRAIGATTPYRGRELPAPSERIP